MCALVRACVCVCVCVCVCQMNKRLETVLFWFGEEKKGTWGLSPYSHKDRTARIRSVIQAIICHLSQVSWKASPTPLTRLAANTVAASLIIWRLTGPASVSISPRLRIHGIHEATKGLLPEPVLVTMARKGIEERLPAVSECGGAHAASLTWVAGWLNW